MKLKYILPLLAAAYVLLFAAVWIALAVQLASFTPTPGQPTLKIDTALLTTAGFLATSVGAGTAAVLGIEIQKVKQNSPNISLAQSGSKAVANDALLAFGVLAYAAVGLVVLLVWLFNSKESPEIIQTFGLGFLGWFAGAFAGVYKAAPE